MIKLAVSGCHGRMGERITHLALQDTDFEVRTLLEHHDHPKAKDPIGHIKISTQPDMLKGCDVLIEFTTPEATLKHLEACRKHKVKMVIGTTGFSVEQTAIIKNAGQDIAIVFSSNMSIGVNIVFKLAEQLGKMLPKGFEIKMTEAHHIHKKDAPSGTAKTLADYLNKHAKNKIAYQDISAIREGEIIGDHKVIVKSDEDTIILDHHAKTRDMFAKGALVAAKFLKNKKNGLFNMQDVLGITN